jgi:hypothetical protein
MTETYDDKLENFCRGKSFLKLRGGVPNSTGELCEACGSGQPGTLFGIRELVTGLDHFVGFSCLRELMRRKAVLQSRVRDTSEQAFARAQKSMESSGNGRFGQGQEEKLVGDGNAPPREPNEGEISSLPMLDEGTRHALPLDLPVIATPTLVVWETEDTFRAAVQVLDQDGLAGVWGAAEQPKWREVLKAQPDNGFLLTREERYDRAALARCVRLATQNAYLTLQSGLAESEDNDSKAPAAAGANDG